MAGLASAFGLPKYELWHDAAARAEKAEARAVVVNVFVMAEAFDLVNCRHLRQPVFGGGLWRNL